MPEDQNLVDHTARGLASEAIQAVRSHEQYDTMRFTSISEGMARIEKKMEDGFKSYDAKFWGLAISVIGMLGTGVLALIIKGHP